MTSLPSEAVSGPAARLRAVTPRPPPLAAWVLTAVLVAAMLAASVIAYRRFDGGFTAFNTARLERMAAVAAARPGTLKVVALGDSRLRHALLQEEEMAALAERRGLPGLYLMRITHNTGEFADFDPVLDEILEMRPDLILIVMDLLFRSRNEYIHYRYHLRDLIDHHIGGEPMHNGDPYEVQYAQRCRKQQNPAWWYGDAGRFDRFIRFARTDIRVGADDPSYERVKRFAKAAEARGIRVAVVQLRSSSRLENFFYGPGNTYYPDALERIARDPDLHLWPFPAGLAGDHLYCDFVHLTPEAGRLFSEALVDRIKAEGIGP